jgi:hypothetical protein
MVRKSFSAWIPSTPYSSSFTKTFFTYHISALSMQLDVTPSTPAAKAFAAGTAAVETVTFLTKANTVDGDYIVIYDRDGLSWAVATDATGSSAEPTGAIWLAVASARRAQADISGDTSEADVAASFETAFDGITGFTAAIVSDDTAADGTMIFTNVNHGPITAAVEKDDDDAGVGTIVVATTTAGVASDVSISADTITETAHGYVTGLKGQLTTDGTLPAGLSTSTDYFIIKVDADTYQLASSLVNSAAGTQIDITDEGATTNTHTFTPTTVTGNVVKLQESNDGVTFEDMSGLTSTISGTDTLIWKPDVSSTCLRLVYTPSAGQTTLKVDLSQTIG